MTRLSLWLIVPVSILFAVGLLMVFNTTAAEIIDRDLSINTHLPLMRQIAYGGLGIGLGCLVYFIGYRVFLPWSVPLLIFSSILLGLVFVPGIGQTLNGARRWIAIGGYSFQPSECVKIFLPLAFIHWLCSQKDPIHWKNFYKIAALFSIPMGLILLEPDNGTCAILFICLCVLCLFSGVRWIYWLLPLCVLGGVGGAIASQMPHVSDRIHSYLHPELDLRGKGHQPHQAKIAAGSGQLFGRGIGESLQKLNYLPEARSDYIAAIYAEECGFMGIIVLILLYMIFACSGFLVASRAVDRSAFLSAMILTFLVSLQAFLNLGIVSGLLPSKGMTLPFFSQGGSSLVMNLVVLFVLLDISRNSKSYPRSHLKRFYQGYNNVL